ncbi:hypothetical protein NQ176_g4651 [Zarea fungicola]|uniref:Uncharacterized protein n=1 Tax=Zarea fungicola TaxID=93591 RepID=A0ACC1NDF1_9HYPO|nr:hypothetical protein NQ176_g4651 [Lecanicillium fungicola]
MLAHLFSIALALEFALAIPAQELDGLEKRCTAIAQSCRQGQLANTAVTPSLAQRDLRAARPHTAPHMAQLANTAATVYLAHRDLHAARPHTAPRMAQEVNTAATVCHVLLD